MHTDSALAEQCAPEVAQVAWRYAPRRPNGKRVAGWEDCNITLLADDMRVSYRYLLGVLTGQRNSTLVVLQNAANYLQMPLPRLIERMERACRLKAMEIALAPDKMERRRLRSVRRAIRGC